MRHIYVIILVIGVIYRKNRGKEEEIWERNSIPISRRTVIGNLRMYGALNFVFNHSNKVLLIHSMKGKKKKELLYKKRARHEKERLFEVTLRKKLSDNNNKVINSSLFQKTM